MYTVLGISTKKVPHRYLVIEFTRYQVACINLLVMCGVDREDYCCVYLGSEGRRGGGREGLGKEATT